MKYRSLLIGHQAKRVLEIFGLVGLGILAIVHFSYLVRSAVDIPYLDEWMMLRPGGLTFQFPRHWLFALYNGHRIVLTKLQIWILYRINGWDFVSHVVLNFIVFCMVIALFLFIKKRLLGRDQFPAFPFFLYFLLSQLIWDSHSWPILSAVHFCILFGFLALFFLTEKPLSIPSLYKGTVLGILAAYSFAGGLLFAGMAFGLILVHIIYQKAVRRHDLLAAGLLLGSIGAWFIGYHALPNHRPYVFPDRLIFWAFFFNLVSGGFGLDQIHAAWGAAILAAISFPLFLLLGKPQGRKGRTISFLLTSTLVTLGILAMITIGRAGFGLGASKEPRFLEFGMMLIPIIAMAYYACFRLYDLNWAPVAIVLILSLSYFFRDHFDFTIYRWVEERNNFTAACAHDFFDGKPGLGICTSTAPWSILSSIHYAADLGVHFTRSYSRPSSTHSAPNASDT